MTHTPYIAVVQQPACANVFLVSANGFKTRLAQHTMGKCMGFAEGFRKAEEMCNGDFLTIRHFTCGKGNAEYQDWKPLAETISTKPLTEAR